MTFRRVLMFAPAVVLLGAAVLPPAALASPGSGFTAPILVTANLDHKVKINSDGVKLQTNRPTDVRVQRFIFDAGGYTGWHHHPDDPRCAQLGAQVGQVPRAFRALGHRLKEPGCHP